MREKYRATIHECVNEEYMESYGLNTKTFVVYCTNPEQPKKKGNVFALQCILKALLNLVCLLLFLFFQILCFLLLYC